MGRDHFDRRDFEGTLLFSHDFIKWFGLYAGVRYQFSHTTMDENLVRLSWVADELTRTDVKIPASVNAHFVGATVGLRASWEASRCTPPSASHRNSELAASDRVVRVESAPSCLARLLTLRRMNRLHRRSPSPSARREVEETRRRGGLAPENATGPPPDWAIESTLCGN